MQIAPSHTTITLVSKVVAPLTVKDFRPIACGFVFYKIMDKVLATRLHEVMPHIISEAQTGFTLGTKIVDNIIMAQDLVKGYTRKHLSIRCIIKTDLQKVYDIVEFTFLE